MFGTFILANTCWFSEGLTVCTHLGDELRITQLLELSFVYIPRIVSRILENRETMVSLPKNSNALKPLQ